MLLHMHILSVEEQLQTICPSDVDVLPLHGLGEHLMH